MAIECGWHLTVHAHTQTLFGGVSLPRLAVERGQKAEGVLGLV